MRGGRGLHDMGRSLRVALPALLTVALLPLGLIAVVQTAQVNAVARDREELTLLAVTERAAGAERRSIERAIGIAQGLAATVPELIEDEGACDARMRFLVAERLGYVFAGFVPASGVMTCSSSDGVIDFSASEAFAAFMAAPGTTVVARAAGAASGEPVVVVSEPVRGDGGALLGFVSLSIAQTVLPAATMTEAAVALVTFNAAGEVIKSSEPEGDLSVLPRGRDLEDLIGRPADVFAGQDRAGRERVFSIVTIVPGVVATLGSWDRAATPTFGGMAGLPVWVFPLLMWAMSLAVAYFAVHWLVIRHVRKLVHGMREFARHRTVPPPGQLDAPTELREIEAGLAELTDHVLREEAEAENRMHEQKVMMKEIHHRVKNNLQLISSIINMQMRQIAAPEARFVLGRVRDRVLGLATIHRNLYEASDVTGVAADAAIREIVHQLSRTVGPTEMEAALLDLAPVSLYPDQAVPLSLFVTEAVTNAIKHGGRRGRLSVRLEAEDGMARLMVENPLRQLGDPEPEFGTGGLGNRLIKAFATQLEGRVEVDEADGAYRVVLTFPLASFAEGSGAQAAAGPEPRVA